MREQTEYKKSSYYSDHNRIYHCGDKQISQSQCIRSPYYMRHNCLPGKSGFNWAIYFNYQVSHST